MMIFFFFIICMVIHILFMVSIFLSKKLKLNMDKTSPFECGFNPLNNSRVPFSLRFFLITIIFLIFDVEITLLLPMIFSMKLSNMKMWLLTSIIFLLILMIGLFHEWNLGVLNWK